MVNKRRTLDNKVENKSLFEFTSNPPIIGNKQKRRRNEASQSEYVSGENFVGKEVNKNEMDTIIIRSHQQANSTQDMHVGNLSLKLYAYLDGMVEDTTSGSSKFGTKGLSFYYKVQQFTEYRSFLGSQIEVVPEMKMINEIDTNQGQSQVVLLVPFHSVFHDEL